MRKRIDDYGSASHERGQLIGLILGAATLGLAVVSHFASAWTYLAVIAAEIILALVLGCVAWLRRDAAAARPSLLDAAGALAFIGFAAVLIYDWEVLFHPG